MIKRVNQTDKVVRKVGSKVSSLKNSVSKLATDYNKGSLVRELDTIKPYQRKRDILDRYK